MRQQIFKTIADLRFAIFILLIIASVSIIGTIIVQDQPIEIYQKDYPLTNPIFGFLTWELIINLGFDHIYKTWWFITLIIVFGISLLTCTILQQLPSLKISRKCQFFRTPNQFKKLKFYTKIKFSNFSKLFFNIKKIEFSIFQQKNIIYAYKGLIGRIGPIIVHFSMILILIGTILGSITGFKAQEIVPKTELFHIQNILSNGKLMSVPNVATRINDFWINYTEQNTVKQFYSDISILNNYGNEIDRQTIFVNSPMRYNGVYFYQTDWNLLALRIQNSDFGILEYPLINLNTLKTKIWLTWIPTDSTLQNGIVILIDNLQGYCSIYDEFGQFLGNLELNEFSEYKQIGLVDIISSTGLQIKSDPGIILIYSGFFFLMISTLVSYITYSQIWIIKNKNEIFIGGNTTRAIFDFEIEFLKLIKS
jgi:cytochrome c biogenesis protein